MQPTNLTYGQVAEELYNLGFWPIPLDPEDDDKNPKKPAVRYKHIKNNGLTKKDLHRFIKQFPDRNVGTVVPDGFVCTDFDAGTTGGLHIPLTPAVDARRGPHYWFRDPFKLSTTKIRVNGEAIGDFKAAGSIVVLPPSTFKGHSYGWVNHPPLSSKTNSSGGL